MYPGMFFNDLYQWWGDRGVRHRPHEGLDLCCYRDIAGQEYRINERIKIPVMYGGEIAHIVNDFLGKSIYVAHDIYDERENRLYTVYGHTGLSNGVHAGKILNEGDIIATIADAGWKKTKVFSHLHISVAWLPGSFPYRDLTWEIMGNSKIVTLCDPLRFLDGKYRIEITGALPM